MRFADRPPDGFGNLDARTDLPEFLRPAPSRLTLLPLNRRFQKTRVTFSRIPRGERSGALKNHHLTICFRPDGRVDFFPRTNDPADLAARLRRLLVTMIEFPGVIRCAAGDHDHPSKEGAP